jgi:hypothetical protein
LKRYEVVEYKNIPLTEESCNRTFCDLVKCPRAEDNYSLCKAKTIKDKDFYYCRGKYENYRSQILRKYNCLFLDSHGNLVQYSEGSVYRDQLEVVAAWAKSGLMKKS